MCGLWKSFTVITICSVCQTYLAKQLLCCTTKPLSRIVYAAKPGLKHKIVLRQKYVCMLKAISRQKLRHVQRNCKGVMNSPVIQHKSIPVIACLQSSVHPAAFPPSPSKLKLHSEYTAAERPQLLLHQCKWNCPSLFTNVRDACGYVCLNLSIAISKYVIKSVPMYCNTSPVLTGLLSINIIYLEKEICPPFMPVVLCILNFLFHFIILFYSTYNVLIFLNTSGDSFFSKQYLVSQ